MMKSIKTWILVGLASLLLVACGQGGGGAGSKKSKTPDNTKKAGFVKCGVSQGLPGFSNADASGNWSGIDVDVCRAVAAAVLGDADKVKYTPLSAKERFTALTSVSAATKDHTLVRKSSVQDGNAGDWVTSAGTSEEDSEWIVLDQNDWTNLASHSFDGCGAPVEGCTNENATNYNADATQDDGSCMFDNACNVDGVEVEASSFQYVPSSVKNPLKWL